MWIVLKNMINWYSIVIFGVLIGNYLLNCFIELANIRNAHTQLPEEFQGWYDQEKYQRAQKYLQDCTLFSLVKEGFFLLLILIFIAVGGFNRVDTFARSFNLGPILSGLIFTGSLFFLMRVIHIPFSLYSTFNIEARYGFNKMTIKTFISDFLKSTVITLLLAGVALSAVLWFFHTAKTYAWVFSWVGVSLFQLGVYFIAPVVILPLFNKFKPLDKGELKSEIEHFASKEHFMLQGIFTMDASRRSTKSNAFFTGFGKHRRIVLYDTLIANHSVQELVAILAHEIGHYKKRHTAKLIGGSIISTGLMFYLLSFFINNQGLFSAFRMQETSIYASFVFFSFLYTPVQMVLNLVLNYFSRRFEYEADAYATVQYQNPEALITALKKLSVDNLSNLTPHPLKVFFSYSHPPILERIHAIRQCAESSSLALKKGVNDGTGH